MPVYHYKCPKCSFDRDIFKPIAYLNREEPCEACKTPMGRQVCSPSVIGDYAGYTCPISGAWVEGRKAHEENLKRHGCRVLETGETEQARREGAQAEADLDRSVEATAEQFYETLPTAKREQLAAEISSGLDVEVVRK